MLILQSYKAQLHFRPSGEAQKDVDILQAFKNLSSETNCGICLGIENFLKCSCNILLKASTVLDEESNHKNVKFQF